MSPAALLTVAAIVAFAASVQMVTGFGFALLAVPLMATVVDPATAVVTSAVLGTITSSLQVAHDRRHIDRPLARRMLAATLFGLPLGLAVLEVADDRLLRALLGVTVLVSTAVLARGLDLSGRGPTIDRAAGFTAGVLSTSLSTNGPPLVIVLHGRGLPADRFRATLAAIFAVSGVLSLALFGIGGEYTSDVLLTAAIALPALLAGFLVGRSLRGHVEPHRFRHLVLGLLVLSGTSALVAAAFAG